MDIANVNVCSREIDIFVDICFIIIIDGFIFVDEYKV